MRVKFVPILLLIAAGATSASLAQKREEQRYQPPPPSIVATPLALAITGFDRSGDMVVSRAELDDGAALSFASADKDRDGKLSLIELGEWAEAALGNRGALPGQFDFDLDGDDSISREEFIGLLQRRFGTFDTNRDGALQRSELISLTPVPAARPDRRVRD